MLRFFCKNKKFFPYTKINVFLLYLRTMKNINRNICALLVALCLLLFSQQTYCQGITEECINIPIVNVSYSFQVPFGDQTEWFGVNSTIGGGFSYKTSKNLLFGIDWGFIFGGNVKNEEQLFKYLTASSGYIINNSGQEAIVTLYERGNSLLLRAGKLFPMQSLNPNSGLYFTGGLGFISNKIRIDVFENDVNALNDDYKKGYDRLSVGPSIGGQFGFMFFGDNNLWNFHAAFEAVYGLTKNIRPYNFDTMSKDNSLKNEFYLGLKVGWLLPIYPKKPKDYYFY